MIYSVDYFDEQGLTGSDGNVHKFMEAQELAKKAVALGAAVRAQVRDVSGVLLFHYPRVTRAA